MKKFYIIITLSLWGIAQTICAQNLYRNYQSNAVSRPSSAVSVVHSNGYVYFFQSDGLGKLSTCDKPMWHNDSQANTKPFLYPLNPSSQKIVPYSPSVSIFSDNIAVNKVCDEANACSHQFGGKSLQQSVSGNTPTA